MKNKFLIGEISKMFDVSIDTLRYYDKIGILKPEMNFENGYREYNFGDIYVLSLILGARYLEIPVKDIKKYLNSEKLDFNLYLDFINKQEDIIDEKIRHLKNIRETINESKKTIQNAMEWSSLNEFESYKFSDKSEFFLIPIKLLIKKGVCKRFSKAIELDEKVIEYYTKIDIKNNKILVDDEYLFIQKTIDSIKIIKNLKNKYGVDIHEISLSKNSIETQFLGSENEIKLHIEKFLKKKNDCKNILIKTLSFFPTKTSTKCFAEIIIN